MSTGTATTAPSGTTPSAAENISTGIATLDTLLGGVGFERRSNVMLSGRPGTGKTTFVWQIVGNLLAADARRGEPSLVLFFAFEEPGEKSLERFYQSYPDCEATAALRQAISKSISGFGDLNGESLKGIANDASVLVIDSDAPNPEVIREQTLSTLIDPKKTTRKTYSIKKYFDSIIKAFSECSIERKNTYLVIDGINSLIDSVAAVFPKCPRHKIISMLERALNERSTDSRFYRRNRGAADVQAPPPDLVIMTAEARSDRDGRWAESYIADTLIELSEEAFAPDKSLPDFQEQLLVCRVPKGRNLHVQRRSACYEFNPGKGIEFYETYAAEGLVSLFHENRPQLVEIRDFQSHDVPSLFPRLSVREFDRAEMNHEYSVRRHLRYIPRRSPMVLHSIDEYWTTSFVSRQPRLINYIPRHSLLLFDEASQGQFIHELEEKLEKLPEFVEPGTGNWAAMPHHLNLSFMVRRAASAHDYGEPNPVTWQQLEKQCLRWKRKAEKKHPGHPCYPLLIETKSIDSFVSFLLELFWSHGGAWKTVKDGNQGPLKMVPVHGAYDFDNGVIEALQRLRRWFEAGIVRRHSTIDPRNDWNQQFPDGWLFARHWYSTLIDTLTYRPKKQDHEPKQQPALRPGQVKVFRFPVDKHRENSISATTWGEWYLAIEAGTENQSLAYRVIENLLSVNKVVKRAMVGGGLPVFEAFYEEMGDARCYGTDKTYNQLRGLLRNAKDDVVAISRAEFEQYRFVMQRLYACAHTLMTIPGKLPDEQIKRLWFITRQRIEQGPGRKDAATSKPRPK